MRTIDQQDAWGRDTGDRRSKPERPVDLDRAGCTRQGKHAPGGKYDYVINGHMIAGFAMVAWPAEYGVSGIMTFIVNQQGRVYEKDLGPKTNKLAGKMKVYDPDPTWTLSAD